MSLNYHTALTVAGNVSSTIDTMDSDEVCKLKSIMVVLSTANSGSPREVLIHIKTESTKVYTITPSVKAPINTSDMRYTFGEGLPQQAAITNSNLSTPLPLGLIIPPLWTVEVEIVGGVAGDSYDYHCVMTHADSSLLDVELG